MSLTDVLHECAEGVLAFIIRAVCEVGGEAAKDLVVLHDSAAEVSMPRQVIDHIDATELHLLSANDGVVRDGAAWRAEDDDAAVRCSRDDVVLDEAVLATQTDTVCPFLD